jgi:hypothetical protein
VVVWCEQERTDIGQSGKRARQGVAWRPRANVGRCGGGGYHSLRLPLGAHTRGVTFSNVMWARPAACSARGESAGSGVRHRARAKLGCIHRAFAPGGCQALASLVLSRRSGCSANSLSCGDAPCGHPTARDFAEHSSGLPRTPARETSHHLVVGGVGWDFRVRAGRDCAVDPDAWKSTGQV